MNRPVAERACADVDRQVPRDINGPLNCAFEVTPENSVLPRQHCDAILGGRGGYAVGGCHPRQSIPCRSQAIVDRNAVVERRQTGSLAAFRNAYVVGIAHQSQTDREKNILIMD